MIAGNEHRTLELKKTTGEQVKAMQTLCAFLNTDGGWQFFASLPKLGSNLSTQDIESINM